ncbi:DUF445 domain-containing protein [Massilia eurypsychrophila]|uniref:DUF445 domain-containing protein n=1 Tax=Massilia eurypsychrophila TaxID=1485217 RepID=A0A2G8TKP4_9BURK|nr:DUF445 family protein [Massilia eurypsychrophila]PIL46539.1 DUF445 domain-containing protein [Massilia eurypsychrophila]
MDKEGELRASKRLALMFFVGAGVLFAVTLFLPPSWWVGLLKAFAEAAMIGALADWFAVVALFKRVPIPFVSRHTAIIPKNKEKIADNLAVFVRDKFLDTESVVSLIRRHDPAQKVADWLVRPDNAKVLGDYLVKLAAGVLDFIEDAPVQNFIRKAVHSLVNSVDLSQSAGVIIESMTRNGRHQQLLDEGINQLATLLHNEETQAFIAQGIVDWLKEEYAVFEKVLPSEMIGRKGADIAVRLAAGILAKVNGDPDHELRRNFDRFTHDFVERLKSDPEFHQKGEEIKQYLLGDDTLNTYLKSLWDDLKAWLKKDLHSEQSVLHQRVVATGSWIGRTLAEDVRLRQSLNDHLEAAVRSAAPEFAQFLTRHIADTVKNWDSKEMSQQIELNIGKDLQYIRINGTVVGGLIGVVLYLVSTLPALLGIAAR